MGTKSQQTSTRANAEAKPRSPVVEIDRVSKSYQRGAETIAAVEDASLRVEEGEFVVLLGRSGSGKTTLLHIAGGITVPDTGEVTVGTERLQSMTAAQRSRFRRDTVGFVFQFFCLMPTLTAAENVALPLLFDRRGDADSAALTALDQVGLRHRATHKPSELSGGEMQRVAVARALVARPKIILADEPTGNLDSSNGAQVMDLLIEHTRDLGGALVVASHDESVAARADRVVVMSDGRVTGP